ncbi:MAG: arsenate reductase [Gammaproteobacteria bacterium]|nr:arsenate reductase [Gammaproteobacteria bacterium]|tara:strand:- start:655 stop:1023 length:369 start_codon:yes stop_codon:yes gene_type:complete
MITLYGINNCDNIRKTKQWLENQNLDFIFHDYKKLGCTAGLAKTLLQELEIKNVINTKGTTWRNLPNSLKHNFNRESAIIVMQENPSVIKRPILDIYGQWMVGFKIEKLIALTEELTVLNLE